MATVRAIPVRSGETELRPLDVPLSTAAWYDDPLLPLAFPPDWDVVVHEPDLPAPLDGAGLRAAIGAPVGAPQLEELAHGIRRVVIVVDDLTRPTPVEQVLPPILEQLATAGVRREDVTILVAAGTHGPPPPAALQLKVGRSADGCRLVAHDDRAKGTKVGVTRFGTPVVVDREIVAADLVIGIGGVYPQHSTGFGGGSKLALGVLSRESIARLHFRHGSVQGSYEVDNDFRADLDEIARMIGFRWTVLVHVDARRRIVRLGSGDPIAAYPAAAAFSRQRFAAPMPGDADVVIANAYPMDISATFMRSKGIIPLLHARAGASRLLLAACPEGIGHHGLFPLYPPTGTARVGQRLAVAKARGWPEVARLGAAIVRRPFEVARRRSKAGVTAPPAVGPLPMLMYQTIEPLAPMPDRLPGMRIIPTWSDVIDTIGEQQAAKRGLRVAIYPCAPLQVFEPERRT